CSLRNDVPVDPQFTLPSFLFSRRRRHTSFSRDWSSDVCSSDLPWRVRPGNVRDVERDERDARDTRAARRARDDHHRPSARAGVEIGRASCREREENKQGEVTSREKKKEVMEIV